MSYHTNASSATSLCYQLQTFKNALRFIKEKTIFALAVGLFAFNANAGVSITVQPSASGTEVIATASGSFILPSVSVGPFSTFAEARPLGKMFKFTGSAINPATISMDRIIENSMVCSGAIGTGSSFLSAASVSGDQFGVDAGGKQLMYPSGTRAGETIYTNATMALTGTLSGLGFAAGTVSCTWGTSGGVGGVQSLTITVLTSPAPTVTSLSPNNGPAAGGTSVTITGTDLTGATEVTIGGVAATNVTVVNATTITATTPAHASGAASVVVTTPGGSNASNSLFTYAPLLTQTGFTVAASPNVLNATTTTSTLSTSGGSGTGAVSYAMTAGSCTLSGSTVTAGTASETCTVTATKAADSAYAASTATVNITVARRASIAAAATDASVLAIHGAQIMQSQKFVTTQIENVANHLSAYRNNLNLRSSQFGFGVNLPSMGPASQALYKIKDELTPRATSQTQSKAEKTGFNKVGFIQDQAPKFSSDYANQDSLTAEVAHEDQKQVQAQIDKSQADAANSYFERESLTYSFWTAGTIDFGNYKTGDNKETQNRLTANGLTMGLDYKLHDSAIVGGAIGFGTAWHNAAAINTNLKA